MTQFEQAVAAYQGFTDLFESVMLSTVNASGMPHASYAPFVMDEAKNVYIFVSGLSTHTQNLRTTGKACVLLIEDEAKSQQIFARRRLTLDCRATLLERGQPSWNGIADKFQARFGKLIEMFRELEDFNIFKLVPDAGRFVIGFGAAYKINADNLNTLEHITGDGHGRRQSQATN
ncbi:MAG: HugZ family protein [Cyanothece sp. SIO1E1]|nr:HugZ family protein [Cyanothece sp. SIO1E1]